MNNFAYIAGIEYAFPEHKISTSELAEKHPEWRMDQVVLRTGVETRYWCESGETALDLAETACRRLIKRMGNDLKQIDVILFCTQSPDHIMPPNACILQHRLNLPRTVAALDYNLACSGFIYGLFLSKALIVSGSARNVLLVTAETYSKWMHPDDRGPMTLFGDAAAATLISASDQIGLSEILLATDGGSASSFFVPAGGARLPCSPETKQVIEDKNGNIRTLENLSMDGAAVLDFVKQEVPLLVETLLNQANLTLDDLDLVIFHQASQVTLDFLNRKLHIPPNKQFSNLRHVGNTVSASIPIALRDAELQGVLKPGMKVMVVGFGVGLSWGGCIINWR
jgi:3-oxoacyl-[acyl-carrier-protein] synthase-3